MSFTHAGTAESLPSPGLSPNLSSNNPFRNRAASPSLGGQRSPLDPPPRPLSRNPFLDASAPPDSFGQPARIPSPDKMSFAASTQAPPPRPALTGNAADLFDNLTLNDKPSSSSNGMRPPPLPRSNTNGAHPPPYSSRAENVPPRHRPSRSQEEALRARKPNGGSSSRAKPKEEELDIFADPVESSSSRRQEHRRPRRNSESSVMSKSLDHDEEKRKQERRRRERRERREREAKDPKSKKPDRKLDIIDKLDVTSIYGTGLFHHDGPFDACNPHRNKAGRRNAPMQAFPKDSSNMLLGGGGPLNKRPDHATFLGHNDDEGFKDYSGAGNDLYGNGIIRPGQPSREPNVESATTRVEPVHGDESLGLGTSTFLEGAPASRTAMQRRESEQNQTSPTDGGGLGRKKSLAQKIRGMNGPRRDYGASGRVTSPDGVYSPEARTPGGTKIGESNPFFNEFSKGDDAPTKKENAITIVEPERAGRTRAPSSPGSRGFGLQRRVTSDGNDPSMPPSVAPRTGGGFLSRVKSLKGGPKKPKVEKPMIPAQHSEY